MGRSIQPYFKMSGTKRFRHFTAPLLLCLICFCISAVPAVSLGTEEERGFIELRDNWEYQWGDSPKNRDNVPVWALEEAGSAGWGSMSLPGWAPDREGNTYLWQRIALPGGQWEDPVVFLLGPFIYFQVYLEGTLIYSHGDPDKPDEAQSIGDPWHIIHLPGNFEGQNLSFRIFSNYYLIGIPEKVLLGSHAAVYKKIITGDIDRLIIGFLCLFLGTFSLTLYLRHRTMKPYFYFAIFALAIGVYVIRYTWVKQFFIDIPMLWIYLWVLSLFSIPIGILGFVRTIFGDGYKNILRYLFLGHLIVAPVLITLMYFLPEQTVLFSLITIRVLYLIYMAALLPTLIVKAVRKEGDALIFLIGFGLLNLFGIFDILVGLGLIPWLRPMSHIGMFLFTITLIIVLERHIVSMYRNLRRLTAERERLSGELHDGISGIMTNINLLTEVVRKQTHPEQKEQALTTISSLSREGLSEIQSFMHLKRLLSQKCPSLLREGGEDFPGEGCCLQQSPGSYADVD